LDQCMVSFFHHTPQRSWKWKELWFYK
jgi:hypothetical protein